MANGHKKAVGEYLKSRRARLDPAAFGLPSSTRRRTPGLRREEVAQRAGVSVVWYTWLEQGRGATPSADALDRIADALALTPDEREHLFLLAQHRPPPPEPYRAPECAPPQLQRILDALEFVPAYVRTATWDIVAWNRAAAAVLTDYGALPPERRNILRLLFIDPCVRARQADWDGLARWAVAAFRADAARAGASESVAALVAEMCRCSPEFATIWRDHDVRTHGAGVKHLRHSAAGPVTLEYAAFTVDGRPDLSLVLYTPVGQEDAERVRALVLPPAPTPA